jgi:16S rRNA (guanine527-N7)-methyltransferase
MNYPMDHLNVTKEQALQLEKFADFLLAYNRQTNLTSITDPTDFVIKHLEDSIALFQVGDLQGKQVLDVGTGAGFPGIVLLIMEPSIKLTLLEATKKKVVFLEQALTHLGLQATVVHDRAELWIDKHRESFDLVTARAVAPLPILVEWCVPYVKVGGQFIAMKAHVQEELKQAELCLQKTGASLKDILPYELSQNKGSRHLVVVDKVKRTPSMYPRPNRLIQKEAMK